MHLFIPGLGLGQRFSPLSLRAFRVVTEVVTAIKFYPRAGLELRMTGGRFEGSNLSSIQGFVTLATVDATPPGNVETTIFLPGNTTPYRFLRFANDTPNESGYTGDVAEIKFMSGETVLAGAVFGTPSYNDAYYAASNAFDGDPNTFYAATGNTLHYVGIDIGAA